MAILCMVNLLDYLVRVRGPGNVTLYISFHQAQWILVKSSGLLRYLCFFYDCR